MTKSKFKMQLIGILSLYFVSCLSIVFAGLAETHAPRLRLSSPGGLGVDINSTAYPYIDYIPMDVIDMLNDDRANTFTFTSDIDVDGNFLDDPADDVYVDFYERTLFSPTVYYAEFENPFYDNSKAAQYWLYYFYNDWFVNHIADWETITYFFDTESTPIEGIYSTHYEANRSAWNNIQPNGSNTKDLFVSNGGHGSYSFGGNTSYTGVNDNHQGDEELITTYTLESLESAESAVIPTGTGSDYNGKWTEFSGAWGRTIGGMLGRAAPAGPYFRHDIPSVTDGNRANHPARNPYHDCDIRYLSNIYGRSRSFPESLVDILSVTELEQARQDIIHYGPWFWTGGYGLDGAACETVEQLTQPVINEMSIAISNPTFVWSHVENTLGYTVKIIESSIASGASTSAIVASRIVPRQEVCNEDGSCSITIPVEFDSSSMCFELTAWNPGSDSTTTSCTHTISLVIDDTGSMSEEISGVISAIQQFVRDNADLNPTIQLITFKDNVTERLISNDADALISSLDNIFASGGGDCPEWSLQAIDRALDTIAMNGTIIFATDASAKPGGSITLASLKRKAAEKNVSIHSLLTGFCPGGRAVARAVASNQQNEERKSKRNRVSIPPTDKEGMVPASALPITIDDPLPTEAFIGGNPNDDTDFFVFLLAPGETYVVDVNVSYGDISLVFIDTDRSTVLDQDAISDDESSRFVITPDELGYFYLKVTALNPASISQYYISVLEEPEPDKGLGVNLFTSLSEATGGDTLIDTTINRGDSTTFEEFLVDVIVRAAQGRILAISPNNVEQSSTGVAIELTGLDTNWTTESTVEITGAGIVIRNILVLSSSNILLTVDVPRDAVTGTYDIVVHTGTQSDTGSGVFTVSASTEVVEPAPIPALSSYGLCLQMALLALIVYMRRRPA